MRIRKTFQGQLPENKIVNTHSTSQTDTYSCDYLNKDNIYSTSEVKTGKYWINGKPIYRKVISLDKSGFATQSPTFNHNIQNIEDFINQKCFYKYQQTYRTIPGVYYDNKLYDAQFFCDNTTIKFELGNGVRAFLNVATQIYVIVEYTKTTDQAS